MDLDTLLQGHRDAVNVRRIYGDPVERDGLTIVPAASVFGGTGGGGDEDGNGGGGFGLAGRPAGAWVIREGEVEWKPAVGVNRIAFFVFLLGLAFALRRRRGGS
jgi:uncharacterized spore protein YtfJ